MYVSRMLINSEIEEIIQFRDGLLPEEMNAPILPSIQNSGVTSLPSESTFAGWNLSSINDLNNAGDGQVLCILASFLKVNAERGWFYDSCKRCTKKLEPDCEMFYCNKFETIVNLLVLDDLGTANVTMFDRGVSRFLDMTAIEVRKEHFQAVHDAAKIPQRFHSFLGRTFVFKLFVRGYTWNTSPSYIVQRITCDPIIVERFTAY
ncbi:replication protein A 70 kDa DNA-binding subunit D-like [Senna tora]|uniref:Replication protein A 70 kDa DNA-binding subunit D-like n=1 Tax=Senna tora TaxID=362788 RepID=A0A834WPV3_9FABA|nr:replication protein A 70 kDa DNA-binding subunit D-like [Senna tora]